ncbi:MAG: alanine racemase [Frankiales bacterium]|nr:alanine racemase [Frankiales bacterium]
MRSVARVDLDAICDNTAVLRARAGGAEVMAVVKADGYGHGMVPAAHAAVRGGATWLGVAFLEEALALRAAGLGTPLLAWLFSPVEDLAPAVAAGVDLGVYTPAELARAQQAAARTGQTARLHLKVDSGLSRGGAGPDAWPDLCEAAAKAQADGSVTVVGVWSHLAFAEDGPAHPVNRSQTERFAQALEIARARGVEPQVRHLANSAALLTAPSTHYDLVRPGAALYGLSAAPDFGRPQDFGLRPAMTLRAEVALTKRVPAGAGVSYRHRYTTAAETTLALVPLGYGDGVPRAATNSAAVLVGGRQRTVAGTVAMDQFVVDVGDDEVRAGDPVVLFGPGDDGEPTVQDWAAATGTIDYEIVTRVGGRVPRDYVGGGR